MKCPKRKTRRLPVRLLAKDFQFGPRANPNPLARAINRTLGLRRFSRREASVCRVAGEVAKFYAPDPHNGWLMYYCGYARLPSDLVARVRAYDAGMRESLPAGLKFELTWNVFPPVLIIESRRATLSDALSNALFSLYLHALNAFDALVFEARDGPEARNQAVQDAQVWCAARRGRQASLARYLNVSRQTVNAWLRGVRQPNHCKTNMLRIFMGYERRDGRLPASEWHPGSAKWVAARAFGPLLNDFGLEFSPDKTGAAFRPPPASSENH